MLSTRRLTSMLRRTMRATMPTSGRSSCVAQPCPASSRGNAEAVESIAADGVATEEHGALAGVHPRFAAQAVGDGTRVRPGPVGVRVVALEQKVLHPDLVAAAQPVDVVEDAPEHPP